MNRYASTTTAQVFALLVALCVHTSAGAQERKVSKEYLKTMYMNYLKEEGYQGEAKGDLIVFKREGATLVLEIEPNDPTFFRIVKPNIWSVDSKEERLHILEAASHSNGQVKIAKTFIVEKNTWVSAETHISSPEGFAAAFKRLLGAIDAGEKKFVEHMKKANQTKD